MSISTQPIARQASLQRVLSARLNAPSATDTAGQKTGSDDKAHRTGATALEWAASQQLPTAKAFAHTLYNPEWSCLSQLTELPARGFLPVGASNLASQLQTENCPSVQAHPACTPGLAACKLPDGIASQPTKQHNKHSGLMPQATMDNSLLQEAASLEADFAAVKAGTAVIADKAAWVAAARHTAQQVHIIKHKSYPVQTILLLPYCFAFSIFMPKSAHESVLSCHRFQHMLSTESRRLLLMSSSQHVLDVEVRIVACYSMSSF